jgi:glutamate-ammonia-ligase adenylyltransferase
MLRHNPALLDRLIDVLGAAPSLSEHLANVPAALEGLAAPNEIDGDPGASLAAQLQDARSLDGALGIASRFVRGEEFRLAVAELDGRIDQDAAGLARTALAEAAIRAILPLVLADHVRRFGVMRGGGMVVVALGKAGSREMMAGSDLDLMLIYHQEERAGRRDRAREESAAPMAPSQYFARAAQALVAALTVPTRDGKLYEVDMRLRPSGGKGPVAVSLAAFERYHRESAWTWERLALTRARVIAGPERLRRRVARAITVALAQGDRSAILPDTLTMRRRLEAELPSKGPWDVKLRAGGLLELEFIAQALQLLHAGRTGVPDPSTRQAFANLAAAGLLEPAEAESLIVADRAWRAVQGLLRISIGRAIPDILPDSAEAPLRRALDHLTVPAAGKTVALRLDAMAHEVRRAFIRHIGEI